MRVYSQRTTKKKKKKKKKKYWENFLLLGAQWFCNKKIWAFHNANSLRNLCQYEIFIHRVLNKPNSDQETVQFNPYYFFRDFLEVFINSSFYVWIIFDKFHAKTTQVDTYCPIRKAWSIFIKSINGSHNVLFFNYQKHK